MMFSCSSRSNRVGYIPDRIFSNDQKENDQHVKWYVDHLTSLQEPSLYELSNDSHVHSYRFLWLRTFDHPIALRLSLNQDGSAIMNIKVTNGLGGYEPGQLTESKKVSITKQQVADFLTLLDYANFWYLASTDERRGLDGATWILEGVKAGEYHVVIKWSPNKGAFRDAALLLVKQSNLTVDKIY
jgi:hypothetical protein